MEITKAQLNLAKKFFGGIDLENLSTELYEALSALIAVGELIASGTHVVVSKEDLEYLQDMLGAIDNYALCNKKLDEILAASK